MWFEPKTWNQGGQRPLSNEHPLVWVVSNLMNHLRIAEAVAAHEDQGGPLLSLLGLGSIWALKVVFLDLHFLPHVLAFHLKMIENRQLRFDGGPPVRRVVREIKELSLRCLREELGPPTPFARQELRIVN